MCLEAVVFAFFNKQNTIIQCQTLTQTLTIIQSQIPTLTLALILTLIQCL